jgi:hypothetical protein
MSSVDDYLRVRSGVRLESSRVPLRRWFERGWDRSEAVVFATKQRDGLQFAVFRIVLAVIAGCFPLLFRRPVVRKSRFPRLKLVCSLFFAAFISDISQRRESPARQLTARQP